MKKIVFILIISVAVILLVLSSIMVFANSEKQKPSLQDKVNEEIVYLDKDISSLLEKFNSQDIKWEEIQKQTEDLYQTWNTVSIDLTSLNIDGNLVLKFSDYLNESMQNIEKQDKERTMEAIASLYNLLPQYSKNYNSDSRESEILQIKSNVVTAYAKALNNKWGEAKNYLTEANKLISNLLNSVNQNFGDKNTISQCYVLINELIRAVELQNSNIFIIEYQNLMDKIKI